MKGATQLRGEFKDRIARSSIQMMSNPGVKNFSRITNTDKLAQTYKYIPVKKTIDAIKIRNKMHEGSVPLGKVGIPQVTNPIKEVKGSGNTAEFENQNLKATTHVWGQALKGDPSQRKISNMGVSHTKDTSKPNYDHLN